MMPNLVKKYFSVKLFLKKKSILIDYKYFFRNKLLTFNKMIKILIKCKINVTKRFHSSNNQ